MLSKILLHFLNLITCAKVYALQLNTINFQINQNESETNLQKKSNSNLTLFNLTFFNFFFLIRIARSSIFQILSHPTNNSDFSRFLMLSLLALIQQFSNIVHDYILIPRDNYKLQSVFFSHCNDLIITRNYKY